ncbi:MAG: universal stress protein [Dehalococcoidia bacterium]|nr:universal stress protein [Dehalococcoidia bacterium]MCB9610544.1 universal stress protein [Polyangiaceae bacterium]
MFESILVTLDGSAYSERVLDYVPVLATAGTRITLLTVIPRSSPSDLIGADRAPLPVGPFEDYLTERADRLTNSGLRHVAAEIRRGSPAQFIVEVARELRSELIVMSTQGISAENEHDLGGVASRVLMWAPCPVFMVRVQHPHPARNSAEEEWQSEGGANVG